VSSEGSGIQFRRLQVPQVRESLSNLWVSRFRLKTPRIPGINTKKKTATENTEKSPRILKRFRAFRGHAFKNATDSTNFTKWMSTFSHVFPRFPLSSPVTLNHAIDWICYG
jgi:hypothetical protein